MIEQFGLGEMRSSSMCVSLVINSSQHLMAQQTWSLHILSSLSSDTVGPCSLYLPPGPGDIRDTRQVPRVGLVELVQWPRAHPVICGHTLPIDEVTTLPSCIHGKTFLPLRLPLLPQCLKALLSPY